MGARHPGCVPRVAVAAAVLAGSFVWSAPAAVMADVGGAAYHALAPCRLADSRIGDNAEWLTSTHARIFAAGRCGLPVEATSIAISLVAVQPTADGYVVAFPTNTTQPDTSTLNYRAGQVRTNATIVQLGDGAFDLVSTGGPDLVVDVTGYFAPAETATAGRFAALVPSRLIDTRDGTGAITGAGLPIDAGQPVNVALPGGVPSDAIAVAVNLTVTNTSGAGFVSVWPHGGMRSRTSILNFDGANQTRAVTAIVPTANNGSSAAFAIEASTATALVVDVTGYFTGGSASDASEGLLVMAPARLLDTRGATPIYGNGAIEVAMPVTASAVVVNTVMMASRPGWLRTSPAGVASGVTSSVNGGAADTRVVANMGLVSVSDRGLEVYSFRVSDVIIDLVGYFTGTAMVASHPALPNPVPPAYPAGFCDVMNGIGLHAGTAPSQARVIGTSVRGRPIIAEYWGPQAATNTVIVVGQVHGNECAPALLTQSIRDNPPAAVGIWLIPTLNPDGHAAYTRENANGVDLNADGYHLSQPETRALMAFTAEIRPVLTLHVHSPNGQAGWYGTGPYVHDHPLTSNAPISSAIAALLGAVGLDFEGAGHRFGRNWFLWQGQRRVWPEQEALLVELHAISHGEVPGASPRPPTRTVAEVERQAAAVVAALDVVVGGLPPG